MLNRVTDGSIQLTQGATLDLPSLTPPALPL
jgi:hypothetical protein